MPKLFIPGPTQVRPELMQAMTKPMFGHRSGDYKKLHESVVTKMKQMLSTDYRVFIFTSSATGVMEAAIRNCVHNKILHTVCGAFSERWYKISEDCGRQADKVEVEWGQGIKPEMVREKLAQNKYEAVTVTYNETSTGVMNPLKEISEVVRKYPDTLLFVDAVSIAGGVKIVPEELGIDVLIFGTQKCLALPPGLAFGIVSPKAFEKSKEVKGRGHYFDFQAMEKYAVKHQTPATPAISLLNGLDQQLSDISAEGMDNREKRHLEMAEYTRKWVKEHGFEMYPEPGFESPTVSTFKNNLSITSTEVIAKLKEKGYLIADGYAKSKGAAYRIGHMGDWRLEDVRELLQVFDVVLQEIKK